MRRSGDGRRRCPAVEGRGFNPAKKDAREAHSIAPVLSQHVFDFRLGVGRHHPPANSSHTLFLASALAIA